jgi:hypothetical protein
VSEDGAIRGVAPGTEPWIETGEGSLFFVNALLAAPGLMVLVPVSLRALLRVAGRLEGPSPVLDTIPTLAAYVVPVAGWLLLVPVWLVLRNLRLTRRVSVRIALALFLAVHLGYLAYAAWWWITGQSFPA